MLRQIILFAAIALATPALAQDGGRFSLGGDAYQAGRSVDVGGTVEGDLFAAGNRVEVDGDVSGSVHAAGRVIALDGAVGTNVYAAGMTVEIDGPVAGNVTAMGNSVSIDEDIAGNLRAMGGDVTLDATVSGSAILGGETIVVDGVIAGDLSIAGASVDWGDDARVGGRIFYYAEDADDVNVPESVASADRVEFRSMEGWEDDVEAATEQASPGFWAKLTGLFGGVILTTLIATLVAALAPSFTLTLRERALASPLRSLWIGALGLSTAIGATVVLAMTGIGIFVAPLAIAAAVALGFAGYVTGAYLLGVWAVDAVGQGLPDSTLDRAIAAFVGAALMALVVLIPFIGWLAVFAVLLIGVGGLVIRLFGPRFYAEV
ncbi:MAG: polymer-forming cytoskeletal protein [Pseudomonadota bacterium]|nr:polymer-forming cytoskeletal protein [Pseudomonadota bacterium]